MYFQPIAIVCVAVENACSTFRIRLILSVEKFDEKSYQWVILTRIPTPELRRHTILPIHLHTTLLVTVGDCFTIRLQSKLKLCSPLYSELIGV